MTPLNIPSGLKDEMRLWRRDFHKYPERGWTEFRTTAKIAEQLAECGWPLRFSKDFLRAEDIMGRVNVGVLRAGEGRNVVPPAALMKIETRGEDAQVAKYVYGRSMEVLKGAAAMYGVSLTVTKQGETISAESDAELAAAVAEAARASEGVTRIDEYGKMAGSDDACWLMERVQRGGGKAAYIGIGADSPAGHHNERFDIDEAAMDIALSVLANSALLICGRKE